MAYRNKTRALVRVRSRQLGPTLGKLAVKRGLSVLQIAALTGASRTTIYSWFAGGGVTNAYHWHVTRLISSLRAGSAEQAIGAFKTSSTPADTTTIE